MKQMKLKFLLTMLLSVVLNSTTAQKLFLNLESAAGSTSTSFVFLASQSSGLVFTHHNDSTADSVFEGQIGVINLDSFSDEDDQADAFDLDSDNDGCFDAIEAGFLIPTIMVELEWIRLQ